MFLVSSCNCLHSVHRSQVLSWEWRRSWSIADRRCSTTSELSTILLPTKVRLILEVLWHSFFNFCQSIKINLICAFSYAIWQLYTFCLLTILQPDRSLRCPHNSKSTFRPRHELTAAEEVLCCQVLETSHDERLIISGGNQPKEEVSSIYYILIKHISTCRSAQRPLWGERRQLVCVRRNARHGRSNAAIRCVRHWYSDRYVCIGMDLFYSLR